MWTVFWLVMATVGETIVNGWWDVNWIEITLATPVAFATAVLFVYLRDLSRYEKYMRERVGKNMRDVAKAKER